MRQYVIEQARVLIGRGADCDIRLQDNSVSRHHAVLTARGHCRIADLGGANVTTLNGVAVGREPVVLADGDTLKIGTCILRFSGGADASSAMLADGAQTAALATAAFTGTLGPALLAASAEALSSNANDDVAVSVVLGRHDEPSLLVRDSGRTRVVELRDGPWTIGRGARCQIRLADQKASREHAQLTFASGRYILRDLESANGTLVNGVTTGECELAEDDTVRIGQTTLCLRLGQARRQSQARTAGVARRAPVVLIPGLCGTQLFKGQLRVWPNLLRSVSCSEAELAEHWGELSIGRAVRETVVIPGLVKVEAFGRLVDFLCQELGYTEGTDLLEFAYDWRQDNRTSAEQLRERVAAWRRTLPDPRSKIIFIAHSMGGLVGRYFVEHLGGLDACARLILLGTPNRGSTRIFSTIVSGRGAIGIPIGAARIRKMMQHFPSVYQLMPSYAAVHLDDGQEFVPLSDEAWIAPDCRGHLSGARAFRETLARTDRNSVPTTCVFGYGQRTMTELRVHRERDGTLRILDEYFDQTGDDAVTETSAVLDRAEIHPVRQRHGALYADQDVQRRLRYELLERPR